MDWSTALTMAADAGVYPATTLILAYYLAESQRRTLDMMRDENAALRAELVALRRAITHLESRISR